MIAHPGWGAIGTSLTMMSFGACSTGATIKRSGLRQNATGLTTLRS
jgi:hypothetical protein